MTITIKYFGSIAEVTKTNEEVISIEKSDFSTQDLLENLTQIYSDLKTHSFVVAVNKTIAAENSMIKNNDIIALLPPFAGG